jgi:hypothetical protein
VRCCCDWAPWAPHVHPGDPALAATPAAAPAAEWVGPVGVGAFDRGHRHPRANPNMEEGRREEEEEHAEPPEDPEEEEEVQERRGEGGPEEEEEVQERRGEGAPTPTPACPPPAQRQGAWGRWVGGWG